MLNLEVFCVFCARVVMDKGRPDVCFHQNVNFVGFHVQYQTFTILLFIQQLQNGQTSSYYNTFTHTIQILTIHKTNAHLITSVALSESAADPEEETPTDVQLVSDDTEHNIQQKLIEITEYSVCLRALANPKILPCIHTFCLECLQGCQGNNHLRKTTTVSNVPKRVCNSQWRNAKFTKEFLHEKVTADREVIKIWTSSEM